MKILRNTNSHLRKDENLTVSGSGTANTVKFLDDKTCLVSLLAMVRCQFASVFCKEDLTHIEEAIVLAAWLHAGQYRKTGEPYLAHLLRVASSLFVCGIRNVDALIAALLHDSKEEAQHRLLPGGLVTWGLSAQVDALVSALTKDKSRHPIEYFEQVRQIPLARCQKLADRLDNLSSMQGAFSAEKQLEYMAESRDLLLICGTESGGLGRYAEPARMLENAILSTMDSAQAAIAKLMPATDGGRTFLTISGGLVL